MRERLVLAQYFNARNFALIAFLALAGALGLHPFLTDTDNTQFTDNPVGTGLVLGGMALAAGLFAIFCAYEYFWRPTTQALAIAGYTLIIWAVLPYSFLYRPNQQKNELSAIKRTREYVAAQKAYIKFDYNRDKVLEYAQHLRGPYSLRESALGAADVNLISAEFAAAEGNPGDRRALNGYRFKILKDQGEAARGGRKTYLNDRGQMTRGFAWVAYPAVYGVTGQKSFIVNHEDVVYARDLGVETPLVVESMLEFNPQSGWVPVQDAP